MAKISFPFNILKIRGPNFTKLYITIKTDKIYIGIVSCHFSRICKRVMALIDIRIMLPLNILRNSGLLLHAKHCRGAIVRFSDNSSFLCPLHVTLSVHPYFTYVRLSQRHRLSKSNTFDQNFMKLGHIV